MKKFQSLILLVVLAVATFLSACTGGNKKPAQVENAVKQAAAPVEINTEAKLLLDYLAENGDYVNSRQFPSMISNEATNEALAGKTLVIDMRKPEIFAKGHIKGAANVEIAGLPDYFASKIKPLDYDKIILACYSGQSASFAALLLRLMGYGNVYAMRSGMSGWNPKIENKWLAAISSAYEDRLDTVTHEKAEPADFPQLNTGKTTGADIFDTRITGIFSEYENSTITADSVFANPEKYYVINYERKDKYDSGHVPGAIRYKPGGTLGILTEMQTIPANKEVVVYCSTGHNSAFVTAYLRLFGYNVKTLRYGNNSFMHNIMVRDEISMAWQPYTEKETKDFQVVK